MKRKIKAQANRIPGKSENPGVVDAGIKAGGSFKKPLPTINKYVSKGDSIT